MSEPSAAGGGTPVIGSRTRWDGRSRRCPTAPEALRPAKARPGGGNILSACPVSAAAAVCQEGRRGGATMSDETLLDELLSTWLERYVQGEDVPASTLCPEHPELV